MGFLRLRFTIRRMMIAAAVLGTLLSSYRMLIYFVSDDVFHAFNRKIRKVWPTGPSPSVMVDLFEGWITVVPSRNDDQLAAEIVTGVSTKSSQAAADEALKEIDLGFDQWRNSIRITARGPSRPGFQNTISVQLSVPRGVRLDLRTGLGNIKVGQDYINGKWVNVPISAFSIRAKNDSENQQAAAQGSITVVALAPPHASGMLCTPTRMQLDAPGRIAIIADFAIVEANAWHGSPPKQWPQGLYCKAEDEGIISFEGSLAKGVHSLRAAHRIDMKLQTTSFLRIEAEAVAGRITGDLLPERVEPTGGTARWVGSLGPEEGGVLRLRTDDGPISLQNVENVTKGIRGHSGL